MPRYVRYKNNKNTKMCSRCGIRKIAKSNIFLCELCFEEGTGLSGNFEGC